MDLNFRHLSSRDTIRTGETGQHYLSNTIVNVRLKSDVTFLFIADDSETKNSVC